MPGDYETDSSSEYFLEPDHLHDAAGRLIETADEMHAQYQSVWQDSNAAAGGLKNGFSVAAELETVANDWNLTRYNRLHESVGEFGRFLATHVETQMTVDSYNAEMFDRYADPDRYDTNPDAASEPIAVDDDRWMA